MLTLSISLVLPAPFLSTGVDKLSFTITNYNGTVTSKCPEGYFSTIIFNCNSTAIWSEVKDHNITKYISADPDIKECEVNDSCNNVIVLCILCCEIYITSRVSFRGVGGIRSLPLLVSHPLRICLPICIITLYVAPKKSFEFKFCPPEQISKMKAWFLKGNIYIHSYIHIFIFPFLHPYHHISIPIHILFTSFHTSVTPFPFTSVHMSIIHNPFLSQSLFFVNQYIVRFNYSGACPNLIPGKIPSSNPQSPVGWILIGMLVIFT